MGIYKIKPLRGGLVSPNGQAIKRETTLKLTPAQAEKLLYAGAEIHQLVGDKQFRLNKNNCTVDFEKLQTHVNIIAENTKKEKNTKEPQIIINSPTIDKQKKSVALDNNTIPAVNIPSIPVEEERGAHDNDSNATNNSKYISYNSPSSSKHKSNNNAQKKRYN